MSEVIQKKLGSSVKEPIYLWTGGVIWRCLGDLWTSGGFMERVCDLWKCGIFIEEGGDLSNISSFINVPNISSEHQTLWITGRNSFKISTQQSNKESCSYSVNLISSTCSIRDQSIVKIIQANFEIQTAFSIVEFSIRFETHGSV
jgi:hypothetical protein